VVAAAAAAVTDASPAPDAAAASSTPTPAPDSAAQPDSTTTTATTTHTELFKGCLDYVWYSRPLPHLQPTLAEAAAAATAAAAAAAGASVTGTGAGGGCVLRLTGVVPLPPEAALAVETALPNSAIPSDHLPLQATFALVPVPVHAGGGDEGSGALRCGCKRSRSAGDG
jgi:hypothetical protein